MDEIETRPIIQVAVHRAEDSFGMATVETLEFESMEAARAKFPELRLRRLRVCTTCGHPECPMCGDSCDTVVDGDDGEMCCDGACTYVEAEPYPDDYPQVAPRALEDSGEVDMWSTLDRLAGNPDYAVCVMAWPWPDGGWMAGIALIDYDYAERQSMSPAVLALLEEPTFPNGPEWNVVDGFANGINVHSSDGPGAVEELVLEIRTREAALKGKSS